MALFIPGNGLEADMDPSVEASLVVLDYIFLLNLHTKSKSRVD